MPETDATPAAETGATPQGRALGRARGQLGALIDKCVADTDTIDDATTLLLEAAEADETIAIALYGSYREQVARAAVARAVGDVRRSVWDRRQPPADSANARIAALTAGCAASLLEFRLFGGLPLRKATNVQIAESAEAYLNIARDHGEKGRWLARVAEALPDGKIAGDHFTHEALLALRESA